MVLSDKVKNTNTYYEKLLYDFESLKARFEFVKMAFDETSILLNPVPLKKELPKNWAAGKHRSLNCPNYARCLEIAGVCHNWKSFTCRYCLGFWSQASGLSQCDG